MKKLGRWLILGVMAVLVAMLAFTAGCIRHGDEVIYVNGQKRYYRVHVPPQTDKTPLPLVLALHPFTGTSKGMANLTNFDQLADAEGFIVLYPQGQWNAWNVFGKDKPDDVQFLQSLIEGIGLKYPVDPDRIYATGASAGGMISQHLACMTDRFAAIAPVMGSITREWAEQCSGGPKLPVLLIHGASDPIVPFNGGETYAGPGMRPTFLSAKDNAAFWARRNGCAETPTVEVLPDANPNDAFETKKWTWACDHAHEVQFYEIGGGGHTWPGHSNWYPKFIVGSTAPEPDATRVIWEFFKSHKRGQ